MSAAIEAGEAVAGFASGIRHGGEGDGSIVEGAGRLIVEEMHLGHHGDRCAVPRRGRLFLTGDQFLRMTEPTFSFVDLDPTEMGGVVYDIHRSAAPRLSTSQMFVLQGLDKPTVSRPFLFRFHKTSLISSLFVNPRRLDDLGSIAHVPMNDPSKLARSLFRDGG